MLILANNTGVSCFDLVGPDLDIVYITAVKHASKLVSKKGCAKGCCVDFLVHLNYVLICQNEGLCVGCVSRLG